MHACMHVVIYVYMYVCMHVCICMRMNMYMYIFIDMLYYNMLYYWFNASDLCNCVSHFNQNTLGKLFILVEIYIYIYIYI